MIVGKKQTNKQTKQVELNSQSFLQTIMKIDLQKEKALLFASHSSTHTTSNTALIIVLLMNIMI